MSKSEHELIEIAQAKKFFELGVVTGVSVQRAPMAAGKWMVGMEGKDFRYWTLATKLGEVKLFSSLDTAVGQLEQIVGGEIVSLHRSL